MKIWKRSKKTCKSARFPQIVASAFAVLRAISESRVDLDFAEKNGVAPATEAKSIIAEMLPRIEGYIAAATKPATADHSDLQEAAKAFELSWKKLELVANQLCACEREAHKQVSADAFKAVNDIVLAAKNSSSAPR
ncbi:MAG: hypothetical protein LBS59_09335 [Puniceicoccales bacterium]|nr:hypothetical protein [Puniceicoccales bacterium]